MLANVPSVGGLTSLDYLVIGIYLAGMLWMGFSIARRQRSTDDFFLGGRNLPAWAVGISIFASLLSTITFLGMPGEIGRPPKVGRLVELQQGDLEIPGQRIEPPCPKALVKTVRR